MGKWRYKKKSKMYTYRQRNKKMNFSYEELYSMYGQYDTFVMIEFHHGSESYNKFGQSLMGTLKYTLEEREKLENILASKQVSRSSKKVLFSPSILHNLSDEQKVYLDREGILNNDISSINSVNLPRIKVFAEKGKKEIPNQLKIKIDLSENESYLMMMGLYKTKMKDGNILIDIEKDDFYGLRLYFEPKTITDEDKSYIIDVDTKQLKYSIREKFLKIKSYHEGLTEEENNEIHCIFQMQWKDREKLLRKEVQRSGENWDNLPLTQRMKLLTLAYSFEDEVLLSWSKPIWWDTERFLHIIIRHIPNLQHGNYTGKTSFQYDIKNVRELIKAVVNSVAKDIEEEFKVNPNRNFNRQGKRAVYYNGNYYKVEIEHSGKLITFHPYNDDIEREKDNQ